MQASGSRTRGPSQNLKLEKALKKNDDQPIPIIFDIYDQRTFAAVGDNADMFKSLLGNLTRSILLRYPSWMEVPVDSKANVWPTIQEYFNMSPIFALPPDNEIRLGVLGWVEHQLTKAYRDSKNKNKKKHFSEPMREGGDVDTIRGMPPPPLDIVEWGRYIDFYLSEGGVRQAEVNRGNRQRQPHITSQGRRSFAEIRHAERTTDGQFPRLVDTFRQTHVMKNGAWASPLAQQQYEDIERLWGACATNGMTE